MSGICFDDQDGLFVMQGKGRKLKWKAMTQVMPKIDIKELVTVGSLRVCYTILDSLGQSQHGEFFGQAVL